MKQLDNRTKNAMQRMQDYVDALTVDSKVNVPAEIVADEEKFFTWDNEKRTPINKPYLFDWSYYNGVIMEGLYDIYAINPEEEKKYYDYIREYLDTLIEQKGEHWQLDRNLAGYVDYHGVDCYKTAAFLMKMTNGNDYYMEIAKDLYHDVADENFKNSLGDIVAKDYTEEALGGNYWHCWAGQTAPKYKVWLDGIYMLQPFITHYAVKTGDTAQLEKVVKRFLWVAETMLAPNGLYYHACNSKDDVCAFHWSRAIGWYAMAMVDVCELLPQDLAKQIVPNIKLLVDGMLKYQDADGMWANVVDYPVTETNRLETSGTAMMIYTMLKAVRKGWLDESYIEPAVKAFTGTVEQKLIDGHLTDIYLKAVASGENNYELTEYYMPDEGKGAGPFIMAYSEMKYLEK